MKKTLSILLLAAFAAAGPARAGDDPALAQAKALQKKSSEHLSELKKAFAKKDIEKARAFGQAYAETILQLDQVAATMRVQGQTRDVLEIEKKVRKEALEHQEQLNRVRDQLAPESQLGIDRALQLAVRDRSYAN